MGYQLSIWRLLENIFDFFEAVDSFFKTLVMIIEVILVLAIIAMIVGIVIGLVVTVKAFRNRHQAPAVKVRTEGTTINAKAISRKDATGNVVCIEWDEITSIQVITLDKQLTEHWAFIALQNAALGKNVMIPHRDPDAPIIFQRISRLPGFDKGKMDDVFAKQGNQRVVIWQKAPVGEDVSLRETEFR
jgi:hypothetical protein